MKHAYSFYLFLLFVLVLPASNASGQEKSAGKCDNSWTWGDKKSFNELREIPIAKRNLLKVDGKRNGGISIKGENRSDILIKACLVAWADTEDEARSRVQRVKIQTDSIIQAENLETENNRAVSYEILVPRNINLDLSAQNGGIVIVGVEGKLSFETRNGGIVLTEIGGDVKGQTKNGGVVVKLSGNSWKGSGLDVETTNGGIQLSMPEKYSAKIETETTNGGFKSDFDELQVESKRNWGKRSISKDLNGGGATVRVATTNGGVRIKSREK